MYKLLLWTMLAANLCGAELNDPAALLNRGLSSHQKGEYDSAIADYQAALKMEMDDDTRATGLTNLGATYNRKHDWAKAIEALEKSRELRPENAPAWGFLGEANFGAGRLDEAILNYGEAIRLAPEKAVYYEARSTAYLRAGQYPDALRDANEMIRLAPESAGLIAKRGAVHQARGAFREAFQDYETALKMNPTEKGVHNNRAVLFKMHRQWNEAVADLDKAIEIEPEDTEAWCNRGQCHADLGNWKLAIADFERSLELTPRDLDALMGLALIYGSCPEAEFRDGKRAVEMANKACELTNRTSPKYLDALALAQAEAGNFDEAVATVDKALELGGDERGLRSRRELYLKKQPYRSLVASDLEGAARKASTATAWLAAAEGAIRAGSLEKAAELYRKTLQANPDTVEKALAHHGLGLVRAMKGDMDSAIASFSESIRLEPDEPLYYGIRAKAYTAKGQHEKAKADLATAERLAAAKR